MVSSISRQHRHVPLPENASRPEQVDLNEIMQKALQKFRAGRDQRLMIRCKELPAMTADKSDICKVFEDIVYMIAGPSAKGIKPFLYVDCEEEPVRETDPRQEQAGKRYGIYFHTNVRTDEVWKAAHQEKINECAAILKTYGACFTVNEIKSAGRLFSISFLGKM